MSKSNQKSSHDRSGISRFFGQLANRTSLAAGRASTFILAAGVIIVWAIERSVFGLSDTR